MKHLLFILALSCFAQDAPQVLINSFDVPKMRALGLPGIPPDAKSHIQAIVRFVDPGVGAVVVIIKGKDAAGVEFSLQSAPALVNQWGAFVIFPFENPYAVSVTEIRLVPMRADETIALKRGQTGLWTAQEKEFALGLPHTVFRMDGKSCLSLDGDRWSHIDCPKPKAFAPSRSASRP